MMISVDPEAVGIREVLFGLRYPARRWELVAQAQSWGADPGCVDELCRLEPESYRSLQEVAAALAAQREQAVRVARRHRVPRT